MIDRAKAVKLSRWSTRRDPFDAPESRPCLVGHRDGDPAGKDVTTTQIVESEGRFVRTRSGSVYELGDPDPMWIEFLKSKGYPSPDPDNPIKIVTRREDLTTVKGWPS